MGRRNRTRRGGRSALGGDALDLVAAAREAGQPLHLMEQVVHETLRLIDAADGAVIELVDGARLRRVATAGRLDGCPYDGLSAVTSLSGVVARTSAIVRCDDATRDPRVDQDACRQLGVLSLACVPIRCADRAVGVLKAVSAQRCAFSDADVAMLGGLAVFIAAAVTAGSTDERRRDATVAPANCPRRPAIAELGSDPWDLAADLLRSKAFDDLVAAREVEDVMARRLFTVHYQPIVDLRDGKVVIAEALSRFSPEPYRPPNEWFAQAWRAGFGAHLELAALERALADVPRLPAGAALAINLSPPLTSDPRLSGLLCGIDPHRVVLELTEHVPVEDYVAVRRSLSALRERGVKLSVDDTGAGFASLSHIVKLRPDIIKLDRELVRGIDTDPVRRSLASAIVGFAADVDAWVVAEGIESRAELEAAESLGIGFGQGHLLGSPDDVSRLAALVTLERAYPEGTPARCQEAPEGAAADPATGSASG